MANVTLKNVKKVFDGKVVAVDNFNLEINDKEFVVFVGPSGCGKSTTLRMIAGLEEVTEGEVFIGDKLVNFVEPKDRDIAMVFQNYALYPHMTVYGNLAFSLRLKKDTACQKAARVRANTNKFNLNENDQIFKIDDDRKFLSKVFWKNPFKYVFLMRSMRAAEINQKVENAAKILEITEYLGRKPKALSGGQRQRVAIGRAIVRKPQVFLMDEPLSNLDAKLRNQMRAEIILLRKKIDTTFIYVTHDQTEAMTLGDRIVIMKDGKIMQVGTPQEVFNAPANAFVAGFIGMPQMNMFDGTAAKKGESFVLETAAGDIVLPQRAQDALKAAGRERVELLAGIRPEHIELVKADEKDAIKGVIDVSEMMGSEVHLHITSALGNVVLRVPTTDLSAELYKTLKSDNEVGFRLMTNNLHLFDKQTEHNILSGIS